MEGILGDRSMRGNDRDDGGIIRLLHDELVIRKCLMLTRKRNEQKENARQDRAPSWIFSKMQNRDEPVRNLVGRRLAESSPGPVPHAGVGLPCLADSGSRKVPYNSLEQLITYPDFGHPASRPNMRRSHAKSDVEPVLMLARTSLMTVGSRPLPFVEVMGVRLNLLRRSSPPQGLFHFQFLRTSSEKG
jgi:hypothetical protein